MNPVHAVFIGWQMDMDGERLFALFNIIGEGHPRNRSTVTETTLRELGIAVPETSEVRS